MQTKYEVIDKQKHKLVKSWTRGVTFDENAKQQVLNMAGLPFIHSHIAIMPDVHLGKGATIGSVIPTKGAIVPAAVGVDLGCGMMAVKTSLMASDLPESLINLRHEIEKNVPHGRSANYQHGRDKGSWNNLPEDVMQAWLPLDRQFNDLCEKHPFEQKLDLLKKLKKQGA